MLNYEAKRFLENCRILKEGEEIDKGKGMAVLFDRTQNRFEFREYNNSATCTHHRMLGSIYLREILDNFDTSVTILAFKKKAREIVGKRHYKLHKNAKIMLGCMADVTSFQIIVNAFDIKCQNSVK